MRGRVEVRVAGDYTGAALEVSGRCCACAGNEKIRGTRIIPVCRGIFFSRGLWFFREFRGETVWFDFSVDGLFRVICGAGGARGCFELHGGVRLYRLLEEDWDAVWRGLFFLIPRRYRDVC